jgi:ATP-dependent DNA helicase RecG
LFGREEIIQQVAPGYVTDCLLRIENTDRYDDRLRVESNLMKYTKLYSGGEPELIEGEIFRTIVPLGANVPAPIAGNAGLSGKAQGSSVTQKAAEKVAKKAAEWVVAEQVAAEKVAEGAAEKVAEWVAEQVAEQLTKGELEVLVLIVQNSEITQNEIAARLGISRKTVYVRVKLLKGKGLIRRVGSNTKGHWELGRV